MKMIILLSVLLLSLSSFAEKYEEVIEQDVDRQGNVFETTITKDINKTPKSKLILKTQSQDSNPNEIDENIDKDSTEK